MLAELIEILKEGRAWSKSDLALRLDVSEAMVEELIAGLVKLGYLSITENTCPGVCSACGRCSGRKKISRSFILNI